MKTSTRVTKDVNTVRAGGSGRQPKRRVALVSLSFGTARVLDAALRDGLQEAFKGAGKRRLVLLPGAQLEKPFGIAWPTSTRQHAATLAELGATGLFEVHGRRGLVYRAHDGESLLDVEIYQRFGTSREATRAAVGDLLGDTQPGGSRTIVLDGLPVGLLVCGENNILANQQANTTERNRAYVRHGLSGRLFPHVPIVFNGAHTPMGNWHKIHRRLEHLSAGGRWAFFATNCSRASWGSTSLRAYYDGQVVADSAGVHASCPAAGGLIEDRADRDAWRLLWLDIPAALLST